MEGEREVKPIQVFLKCEDCNIEMILTEERITTKHRKLIYIYNCGHCKRTTENDTKYPYIKFK